MWLSRFYKASFEEHSNLTLNFCAHNSTCTCGTWHNGCVEDRLAIRHRHSISLGGRTESLEAYFSPTHRSHCEVHDDLCCSTMLGWDAWEVQIFTQPGCTNLPNPSETTSYYNLIHRRSHRDQIRAQTHLDDLKAFHAPPIPSIHIKSKKDPQWNPKRLQWNP